MTWLCRADLVRGNRNIASNFNFAKVITVGGFSGKEKKDIQSAYALLIQSPSAGRT